MVTRASWPRAFALAAATVSSGALVSATAPPVEISIAARALQPGELAVATITTTDPVDRLTVRAFGRDEQPFRVEPRVWQVLIGIDLETAPGTYPVAIEAGTEPNRARVVHQLVVRSKAFPTRRLSVDDAFVNPPPSVLTRIDTEARALAALWTTSASTRFWSGPFVRPVPQPANSAFGSRSVFNGQARAPHGGADFLSPAGTPVEAPNAGRVVLAKDLYYTGNTIVVDHGLGLLSLFAHLSAMDVHEGDTVISGQIIGRVGATGRVTGPHLHWMVRAGGARVDPLSLLSTLGAAGSTH